VASRGLDFPDVANIMLFDPPDGKDDYINKVGRTARIDQNGSSLLVLCEKYSFSNIIAPTLLSSSTTSKKT
jgi:superfamily II DNA/RNA helicase